MAPLKVLITNITLASYTGTEMVVRDLAIGLKQLGHFPMIFCPLLGGVSEQIIKAGIPLVSDLASITTTPDIIHGHHHVETMQAILKFPDVPAIFVCHDATSWHDIPPQFPTIQRYITVDKNCRERLMLNYQIPASKIETILNWVDTDRFCKRKALPEKPQKALVFSSYAKANTHLQAIERVCANLRLPLDVIGFGVSKGLTEPEKFIGNYDLVFAIAKCAIEALATGAAVILCSTEGLGEMVTMSNLQHSREWNFGRRLLVNPITEKNILQEIKKYSANESYKVSNIIREQASFTNALEKYLTLYNKVIAEWQSNNRIEFNPTIKDDLIHLLNKANVLEQVKRQPFLMPALSIQNCEKLKLSSLAISDSMKCKQYYQAQIELHNRNMINIGSFFSLSNKILLSLVRSP